MKIILFLMFIFSSVLFGCNFSEDSGGEKPSIEDVNDDPQSSLGDSPNPYPVLEEERVIALDELIKARKEMLLLEGKLIAPAIEDLEAYDDFLKEDNTGLVRLFPRGGNNEKKPMLINGNGAYYQFRGQTHEYGYGSDIQYSDSGRPQFSVGFAGVDYGFFAQLGKVDIRTIDSSNKSVSFVLDYTPPHNLPEVHWRAEYSRWSYGEEHDGVVFKNRTKAIVGMSYVLRSVSESNYDIAVVFQVVRRDPTDGTLILAWKILDEFAQPILDRN